VAALQWTCVTPPLKDSPEETSFTFECSTTRKRKQPAARGRTTQPRQAKRGRNAAADEAEEDSDSDSEEVEVCSEEEFSEPPPLTFEEIQKIYTEAGRRNHLELWRESEQGVEIWREVSPGHDERECLVPHCPTKLRGCKHTDNALLSEDVKGLKYTCLSDKVSTYLWTKPQENEESLILGGDLGLAKLLFRMRGDSIVNVAGDGSTAVFYIFSTKTGLWKESYAGEVRTREVPKLIPRIVDLHESYKQQMWDMKKAHEGKKMSKAGAAEFTKICSKVEQLGILRSNMKSISKRQAILTDATTLFRDLTVKELFDKKHELLSVKNGVVELRTEELRPRRREDYLTFASDVPYLHDVDMSDFVQFMQDITLSERLQRPEFLERVQRLTGYSATGLTREQIFILLHGALGSNGKSKFVELLCQALGEELFKVVSNDVIVNPGGKKAAGSASTHLAVLRGARCGIITDCPNAAIDEDQIKTLTGDGKLRARDLHQKEKEAGFENTATIWACCNNPPQMQATNFMARRLELWGFDAKFLDPDCTDPTQVPYDAEDKTHFIKDLDIVKKIKLTSVLRWVVQGAGKYLREGAGPRPQCCALRQNEVMSANDDLQTMIDSEYEIGEGFCTSAVVFKDAYAEMMRGACKPWGNATTLAAAMAGKGFSKGVNKQTGEYRDRHVFWGLRPIPPTPPTLNTN
jgi:phage/plasmid-associated DNA primase